MMPVRRRNHLRLALMLLIIGLVAVSYWASTWVAGNLLSQSLTRRAEEKAQTVSLALESLIAAQNRHLQITASLTANRNSLGRSLEHVDAAGAQGVIKEVLDRSLQDSGVAFLEMVDRDERVVYRTNPTEAPTDPAISWGAFEALSGRNIVSGAVEMGLLTLRASEPVYHGKDVVGAVTAGLRITPDLLKEITRNLAADIALLSREGKVLAANSESVGHVDVQAINEAFSQKIAIYRHDDQALKTRGYFPVVLIDSAYIMVVDTDSELAYRQLAQASRRGSLIFLGIALLSLVLGLLCLRWILRPLLRLRQRAETLALELTGSKIQADSRCDIAAVIEVLDGLPERLASRNAELLAAGAKAEAASRAKTQFIANVSHEVRTPMNAIIGMSHILSRSIQDPAQRDKLDIIRHAADQLLELLDNILDLSRLDSERMDLEQHPFSLALLMRHLEALVSRRAAAKGLKLIFDIDRKLLDKVLVGDALRLQQVLVNLVGNAIKFTHQGSVTVAIHQEDESAAQLRLGFSITDTGIGIQPAYIQGIFAPFEQVDGAMTRQFGGSGLGLTISQRFVHLMGGNIEVASTPGTGSTFSFSLEFAKPEAPGDSAMLIEVSGAEAEKRLRADFRGTRVLLADDDLVNQAMVQELLRDVVGFHVDLAVDGEQALALAEAHEYALILMDIQMPKMDGLEATRRIRRLPGYVFVPIIAMTANSFADIRASCFEAGMNDFLSKPVAPERLFVTLLTWMQTVLKS